MAFQWHGESLPGEDGAFVLDPDAKRSARLAVSFHIEAVKALAEVRMLFSQPEIITEESRNAWEEYYQSCPVARIADDFVWEYAGEKKTHTRDEIRRRQYWHCVLANVYDLPFNELKAYMAPDKSTWFGVWSNDGPDAIRALSHTNRHPLARTCIVEYIRTALSGQGDLSWYLHATGKGCLGNAGDSGRLSHGVPLIVRTVADYVDVTGDRSVLDEAAGDGGTVWEKLKRYMRVVFEHRDVNGDGLVEWCNLWEGGADDKVGCFFSSAPLHAWIEAVVKLSEGELRAFYHKHSRPAVNLYEQAFFLHALRSMEELAVVRGEETVAAESRKKCAFLMRVLEDRHWNEDDGFYYDWDVKAEHLTRSMNQDAFYLLHFLKQPQRVRRVMAHLDQPEEFGLRYIPTLSGNAEGFRADGYWCGGYWPRESSYIGEALLEAGDATKAYEVVMKALCCGRGKEILENVNPLTGLANTPIVAMAYNGLLNLVLIRLEMAASSAAEMNGRGLKGVNQ